MALYNPTYQQDPYEGLSDEERKRRQEEEARAAAMADEAVASGGGYREPPSIGDIAGQAFDRRMGSLTDRLNTAKGYFTDPRAALQQRLGVPGPEVDAEPTPVKQTITTDPQTGEQKVKIEGSARDLSAANPLTPTIVGPVSPEQQAQQEQQMAQQMAQYRVPQAQPRTMAPPPEQAPPPQGQPQQAPPSPMFMAPKPPTAVAPGQMPATLPAQGPIPAEAANQAVEIPGLPKIGPAVQLAGPMSAVSPQQLATQPAPATATAPAPATAAPPPPAAEAPWIRSANEAGTDFLKLAEVASKFPESRDFIIDKIKSSFKSQSLNDDANKIVKAAEGGDLKAWNKMQQAIRPETGRAKEEVTVNDYLKAYMYKRLGLDALAQDVQNKIIGKDTKFGQISINGSNWQVETDPSGQIVRARDDEGNVATESTLNRLRAAGTKFGQQATQYTGGIHTVPNADGTGNDLVMPTQNQIDPTKSGFTYLSGPKQGQMYTGTATPQPQSIGTSYSKALDKAFIDFTTSPTIAGATRALELAYATDPGDGSVINQARARINSQRPDIFNQVKNYSPSGNVAERLPADTAEVDTAAVARVSRDLAAVDREIAKTTKTTSITPERKAQSLAALNDERNKLVQKQQQLGAPAAATGGTTGGGMSLNQRQAQQKANVEVGAKRSESFNKYIDENLVPAAEKSLVGSDTIKKQMKLLNDPNNSVLFGLYDASQSNSAGDKRWAIIRDVFSGAISRDATEVSNAVAQLGLNSDQRSALDAYSALNMPLVAATVHQIGGAQISDRDRAAAEKAQVDLGRTPALGAFNIKSGQQFGFDMARYKADWSTTQNVSNIADLNKLWNKEQARLVEQNGLIADQRMAYLKSLTGDKPANTAQVRAAFQKYQVPEYDPNLNGGAGGWKKLRQQDVKTILGVQK